MMVATVDHWRETCCCTSLMRSCCSTALESGLSVPHPQTHTCPWPQSHGCSMYAHVSDPNFVTTLCFPGVQTPDLQLPCKYLYLRHWSHCKWTWTPEPLSSANARVLVPSSMAAPHVLVSQAHSCWWASALDPGGMVAPQAPTLQISGMSLFHGCHISDISATTTVSVPEAKHSTKSDALGHDIPQGRKRCQDVPSRFHHWRSQQHSQQLQIPLALAFKDPCSLHQWWPKLTELHGDYATWASLELEQPQSPSQCLCSHPQTKAFPHQNHSVKSGRGDWSIKCTDKCNSTRDNKNQGNMTSQKEHNNFPITDPKNWRSTNCQRRTQNNCVKEVQQATREHKYTT